MVLGDMQPTEVYHSERAVELIWKFPNGWGLVLTDYDYYYNKGIKSILATINLDPEGVHWNQQTWIRGDKEELMHLLETIPTYHEYRTGALDPDRLQRIEAGFQR